MPSSNDILGAAGDLSGILAAIEANRAKGRVDEAGVNQNQGRVAGDIYRTQSAVALGGPKASAQNAALGDTLANVQPFKWTGGTSMSGNIPVPEYSGGLTPANFGPATRKAGADLATLSADRVSSPAFNIPKPPVLAPVPQSNALDSILGTAGILGTLGKAAANAAKSGVPAPSGSTGGGNLADIWKLIHPGDPDQGSPSHQEEDTRPTGSVDTGEFSGSLPDYGGTQGGTDPSQLPGGVDPVQEYYDWLASQTSGGGTGSGSDGPTWGDE